MKKWILLQLILIINISPILTAQSIVNSKHNLSISSRSIVKSTNESEICIFCHTPHKSNPASPLWNRNNPGSVYTLYNSATLQALTGQPDGSSILCLSCHDGSIALGNVISRTKVIDFETGNYMPKGNSNLTRNLKNDHPISFVYNSAIALSDGQLKDPASITAPISLERGKVQCTSCHDPHKNLYSDFLLVPQQNSNLCNSCHQRTYWTGSSHSTSNHLWNGVFPNPWPFADQSMITVAQNGCESCHNSHNSKGNLMLLKYQEEENNCLDCHNGNVASKNISAQFAKTYKHNIKGFINIHEANESALVTNMHVECIDCHNPHASKNQTAKAPFVTGFLVGVKGINQNGIAVNPATNSFEICYRCHAGSPGAPASSTLRQIDQNNVRLEFAPNNPSSHSITAVGVNSNVPSLIAPWTTISLMYCTDCHSSDGTESPVGPHGSIYPHILKLQYLTADNTVESTTACALCYSCHSRTSIMADNSFKGHSKHLASRTSCNVCHDPHGISSTQGNSTNNSNLINFATSVVSNSSSGIRRFDDLGLFHGRCYLTCHGVNHNPFTY